MLQHHGGAIGETKGNDPAGRGAGGKLVTLTPSGKLSGSCSDDLAVVGIKKVVWPLLSKRAPISACSSIAR